MSRFGVLRPPRQVLFGSGVARSVGRAVSPLGARALVCTDAHVAASPALQLVVDELNASGVETSTFADCAPDVPLATVEECVALARRLRPQVIVAVGGGSVIDLGKLTALLLVHNDPVSHFYGENRVPGPVLPLVALPTTAGTGSEVTPVAVLSEPGRLLKVGVSSSHLVPTVAICDPDLLRTCPPSVAAHSGIDALAHAIEAFSARRRGVGDQAALPFERVFVGKNELSDLFALEAVGCIGRSLVQAVNEPDDEAREAMAYGSLTAGLAFATAGTAVAHALQYPIGARTKTPHGLGVGILLPYVMAFNSPACRPELATIAARLGVGGDADAAVDRVEALCRSIGIPSRLAEIGVEEASLDAIAAEASGVTRLVDNNPRPAGIEDLRRILQSAWQGEITPLGSLRGEEASGERLGRLS